MNAWLVCGISCRDLQEFCTKCGARLYQRDKPVIIEWLSPTSFIDY